MSVFVRILAGEASQTHFADVLVFGCIVVTSASIFVCPPSCSSFLGVHIRARSIVVIFSSALRRLPARTSRTAVFPISSMTISPFSLPW